MSARCRMLDAGWLAPAYYTCMHAAVYILVTRQCNHDSAGKHYITISIRRNEPVDVAAAAAAAVGYCMLLLLCASVLGKPSLIAFVISV